MSVVDKIYFVIEMTATIIFCASVLCAVIYVKFK